MEQIQGIPHILDMLESIKKYLYVRNREQEAGHQRPDEEMLKSAPGIMFETGTDAYGYGICLGDQSLQWSRYHGIWTVDRIIRHRYSQLPLIPCERNNLSPGAIAFLSEDEYTTHRGVENYHLILDTDKSVHWSAGGSVNVCDINYLYNWRVEVP